jgi:hypothetical protein
MVFSVNGFVVVFFFGWARDGDSIANNSVIDPKNKGAPTSEAF